MWQPCFVDAMDWVKQHHINEFSGKALSGLCHVSLRNATRHEGSCSTLSCDYDMLLFYFGWKIFLCIHLVVWQWGGYFYDMEWRLVKISEILAKVEDVYQVWGGRNTNSNNFGILVLSMVKSLRWGNTEKCTRTCIVTCHWKISAITVWPLITPRCT